MATRAERTAENIPRTIATVYELDDPELKSRVVNLLISQVPYLTIAKTFGIPKIAVETINNEYKDIILTCRGVQKYKATRKDLLNAAEALLLKSVMDENVLARANLRDRAFAFKEVFAARRLEEDKSTRNVSQSVTYTNIDLSKYKANKTIDR